MKLPIVTVLAAALACGAAGTGAASAAAPGFTDSICPEATQYVIAVEKLTKDDPAQKVYDTAQAAVDAYGRCSKDKLSNGFREPQHYADTRGAGLAVLASRALIQLNRTDDARRELKQYRAIAQNVVDWQTETETPHNASAPRAGEGGEITASRSSSGGAGSSSGGRRPSVYRAAAKEIVAAADELLAQLDARAAQPAPAATPAH
ncbi:MAG TPA: hypothetical protein VHS78_13435 [Candidatus Elarobacter sp.]|jgi:hypothetical protein|nr:hypothetical protein [Candidatus Elarobacter sp.]